MSPSVAERLIGMESSDDRKCLEQAHRHALVVLQRQSIPVLPEVSILENSKSKLPLKLPEHGLGIEETTDHLLKDIAPALSGSSLSPNYYGLVIGGTTPAARIAESIVSLYDQNPCIHLPDQSIASTVEDKALRLLSDLLRFDSDAWSGIFTTGATASNILGLACGREHVINHRIKMIQGEHAKETVGSLGLLRACMIAKVENVHIYTTMAHSSLYKASSLLGLGRSCVQHIGKLASDIGFDFKELERKLECHQHNSVTIVVISCAEVNTGLFATSGMWHLQLLRSLCDRYGAWLHVDGAFGLFSRILPDSPEFEKLVSGAAGMELADSIGSDGHKLLNVPYDCGIFICRHNGVSQQVFQNPNAAYLNTKNASTDGVQSPLNIGIENSRRFRGLPVYASLVAYGRTGYQTMLMRQIRFARAVATYLFDHDDLEVLPKAVFHSKIAINQDTFIIVLFRAKDRELNNQLVELINSSSKMYVSGTVWDDEPASRLAVANWQVDPERDIAIVKAVFKAVIVRWSNSV